MYELSVFQQGGVDVIDSRSVAESEAAARLLLPDTVELVEKKSEKSS